jgi:hypothetical protein
MDYHKCLACRRGWVNERLAKERLEYAKIMLEKYPQKEDWWHIRFSDEVHFGWGPTGPARVIRKPGERYCNDCLQETNEPDDKAKKRFHCWAAVGHDFKSKLYFYDSGNSNGKMNQETYVHQILEPIVKPWINSKVDFVLEEDRDSAHGIGKRSRKGLVQQWKAQNGLKSYFNCPSSPDLAPIENCWQPPKQYLRKYPHWDDQTTRELIIEGWERVSQRFIDEKVDSMPKRLHAVIDGDGKMTGC